LAGEPKSPDPPASRSLTPSVSPARERSLDAEQTRARVETGVRALGHIVSVWQNDGAQALRRVYVAPAATWRARLKPAQSPRLRLERGPTCVSIADRGRLRKLRVPSNSDPDHRPLTRSSVSASMSSIRGRSSVISYQGALYLVKTWRTGLTFGSSSSVPSGNP
jgi:hypothetical protein